MLRSFVLCFLLWMQALPAAADPPRVLVIGDSLLASHKLSGRSVGDYLETYLGTEVTDRSTVGARMVYRMPVSGALGLSIPQQYRGQRWDWVIVNGGGNDLWMSCACRACARRLDKLISASGTKGVLPGLLYRLHQGGARIVYVGYLRSPGIGTPVESCKTVGNALEARVERLARQVPGLHYLSLHDLIPPGDLSYLALDRVHPSAKASREIARRIAALMTGNS